MPPKLFLLMVVFLTTQPFSFSQQKDTITEKDAGRVIRYLAADSLKGRGNVSPDLLKVALFIGNEFRKDGLQVMPGAAGYYFPFHPFSGKSVVILDQLTLNGKKLSPAQFSYFHPRPGNYSDKKLDNFKVIKLDSFITGDILEHYSDDTSSLLLWTDQKQPGGKIFPAKITMPAEGLKRNVLVVYNESSPQSLSLAGFPSQYLMTEYNVVGLLPGRSKPEEVIIFSAHYDHEGVYGAKGDSILNGANDNASGTTALLLLADYFCKRKDNERTILFCAFAAEELGLLGSKDFVEYIDPVKIIAGINIEMIGVPQYGKNKITIIGEKYSDLPRLLSRGFKNRGIVITREPSLEKQLFQRSDNYYFALKGIPFHTIMSSDDDDACYHQPCDEVKRINIANMTRIINAIAAAARPLINGEATPRRTDPDEVKIEEPKQ
ncbi:MAG: M28 family peptidase [Bacteroidetes bacterium]|nr:MAG: M28 family peptidase [Bacteroidota bacterium]